jgi:hypothetical protein
VANAAHVRKMQGASVGQSNREHRQSTYGCSRDHQGSSLLHHKLVPPTFTTRLAMHEAMSSVPWGSACLIKIDRHFRT